MARPSLYDELVKPHLNEIRSWAASGATDKEIADALGVSTSALYTYKGKYPELKRAFARGRVAVCCDIKAALYKKAVGFEYQEKRQNIRKNEDGESVQFTEITTKYCVPSETAAAMLLRNYDPEWSDSDDISRKFRQQEHELKSKIANANNWLE